MAKYLIHPSPLSGRFVIPPSKSHTLRALLFALMAKGKSTLSPLLSSPDAFAMIEAVRLLGAKVDVGPHVLEIQGTQGHLSPAEDVIHAGNSGQVLRFLGALAALSPNYTVITGDASIRHNRPLQPLLDGLSQLGAWAVSSRGDGHAPLIVRGPLVKDKASLRGEDSQPVSALLLAASFAPHPIELSILHPGETPWVELTLSWLRHFRIPYEQDGYKWFRLPGGASIEGFQYTVPGDMSSASYPIAAALLTQSDISLFPIDKHDAQGDKALFPLLEEMGASLEYKGKEQTLWVKKTNALRGRRIDVNPFIDALPLLAVLSCFAEGETHLYNAAIARRKESDRLRAMTLELTKMGACIEEKEDGLVIRPRQLVGASLYGHKDHRVVLSLAVAALAARGTTTIEGAEVVTKSYPTFFEDMQRAGAKIERCD